LGSKRITNKLRAYHEAGHYVAKWALVGDGVYGDSISIVPNDEEGTGGRCQSLYEDNDTEEGIRAYIVSLYAGAAAECRSSLDPEYVSEGSWHDDDAADKYLHFLPESEQELRNQTREIIDANWQVVERVANELLEHRTLDADEASFLVEDDMEGLEHYRSLKNLNRKKSQRPSITGGLFSVDYPNRYPNKKTHSIDRS